MTHIRSHLWTLRPVEALAGHDSTVAVLHPQLRLRVQPQEDLHLKQDHFVHQDGVDEEEDSRTARQDDKYVGNEFCPGLDQEAKGPDEA